ncbi:tetratricopeptide repeat protein [Flavobacterium sp.]|uniref:tetratricopeptide repeat protein n=1 Tax=Flavobacterium sp. TaxID=239 RepID=UPI0028BD4A44|nr:tetratricopeptide repeat protein [Flavobacterium sp.]
MKKGFLILLFFLSLAAFSQNEQLAQNYFDRGEFEKALSVYDDVIKKQPYNYQAFQKMIACCQQLQQYEKAEKLLLERIEKLKQDNLYVELGYNYQLQKNQTKADKYYQIALDKIKENPNTVYGIAATFEQKVLVEKAIQAYELGKAGNPSFNFDYQLALLQGQLGNTDLMIEKLLDFSFANQGNLPLVQNQLTRFMNEDAQETFNSQLRKALLLRTQKNQDIFWNQFLSWFFVQQKDYSKAFTQEKAIFKRSPDNFYNFINLAKLAIDEDETVVATDILNFILQNTQDLELQLQAHHQLVYMEMNKATSKEYPAVKDKLDVLVKKYGVTPYSIDLQILQAHFYGFYLKDFNGAKAILERAMTFPIGKYQMAAIKEELADLLLLNEKFNQSIIYYGQIEDDLKNDELGHDASFKMAKASYYKGDFDWAQKQFKVLKSSSSQLIANDALELFLLISDNTVEDSTQVALKKFAKADFLKFQNKTAEALQQFQTILKEHKGQSIEDETLLKIGQLYEQQNDYQNALNQYQQLLEQQKESIYTDEALFFSAELYRKHFKDDEKAKALYEKVIFNHQDSIYFVEARQYYRKLRGDTNL